MTTCSCCTPLYLRCNRRGALVLAAFLTLLVPSLARAATLNIPSQYTTIQAAVNMAQSGDTVLVADGTYTGDGNRDIDFVGKNLTVRSMSGDPNKTIINCGGYDSSDGTGNHRGFYLHSGETKAVISGFTVKNGYEGYGGGIYIDGSNAAIQNCNLTRNSAVNGVGGGVYNVNTGGGTTTVTNCTFTGNDAAFGGGIYNVNSGGGTITLTNCTCTGNTAHDGGGVFNGGFLGYSENGTILLADCIITGNNASYHGGGVENDNGGYEAITLTNCTITGNYGGPYNGGGVWNVNNGNATITLIKCNITGNVTQYGGGVYNQNSLGYYGSGFNSGGTITLIDCTITANKAYQDGGGVYNQNNGGTITLTNCTITGNTAVYQTGYDDGSGGGVFNSSDGGTTTLLNCTFTENTANSGGGVYNTGATFILTNDLFSGDAGSEVVNDPQSNNPKVSYCDVQGGYANGGTGNLNADPLFISAALGNLHLKPGSPCLGAGTSTGAPTTDEDGNARPNPPSIGAYEVAAAGHTHLLWTNANGMAAIWTVSPDGSFTSTSGYGPFAGWTARSIADGTDGKTRLLWTRSDGMNAVWTVNTGDGSFTSTPGYGPLPGWNVASLAVGPDNLARLQWKRTSDGMSSIWTVAGDGSFTSTPGFGPYGPWTAGALAVGSDGLSRLLWGDGAGRFSVWTLDALSNIASTPAFGPIPGWSPTAIAGGPDTNARLLLNRSDGGMAVWTVNGAGAITSTPLYGPIPSWTCHGLAVGPDALSRVLWSRTDGMSSVWTIASDGSIASTPGYGPYSGWSAVALSAGPVTPIAKIFGLNFGPYVLPGQDPTVGTVIPKSQVTSFLQTIAPYTQWVRTFGTTNGLENVPSVAHGLGLKTAVTAYVTGNAAADAVQINGLVQLAQAGQVDVAIVGNEALLNNLPEATLLSYIAQVRQQIPAGIPVTTVDTWDRIRAHPNVIAAVDLVLVNIYPFYENATIDQALAQLQSDYAQTVQAAAGKPVWVSETGWPSAGFPPSMVPASVPSPANAAAYFVAVAKWSRTAQVPLFYFEAFDEPWKASHNDYSSWGLWDASGHLKAGMAAGFQP